MDPYLRDQLAEEEQLERERGRERSAPDHPGVHAMWAAIVGVCDHLDETGHYAIENGQCVKCEARFP